jgi:hypothetical protein
MIETTCSVPAKMILMKWCDEWPSCRLCQSGSTEVDRGLKEVRLIFRRSDMAMVVVCDMKLAERHCWRC